MIISVASGKGGTGKTLVATSLALSLAGRHSVTLLDCDVEEPNDHLFIRPRFEGSVPVTSFVPVVDETRCTYCGECARLCVYHAIAVMGKNVLTFPQMCHGCGACSYLCPEKAITEEPRQTGTIEFGEGKGLKLAQGTLSIGETMAPPIIKQVKKYGGSGLVIRDAPPGTSCPVIEAVKGSDFCLLVTEPTPFGLNDLILAVETVRELGIPLGVVLNRAGSGDEKVEAFCSGSGIPLLMTIPLDMEIARLYSRGITLAEGMPQWQEKFRALFETIAAGLPERIRE